MGAFSVITSYSIHYTKLYDHVDPDRGRLGDLPGVVHRDQCLGGHRRDDPERGQLSFRLLLRATLERYEIDTLGENYP